MSNSSLKYYKYIVKCKIKEGIYYTVWGLDLENDIDKFIVFNSKVILFSNLQDVSKINSYEHCFFDKENFKIWLQKIKLKKQDSFIDFTSLLNYNSTKTSNFQFCSKLLNSLNIVQDLFYQLDDERLINISRKKDISALKDFLFDKVLWKEENENTQYVGNIEIIKLNMEKIYNEFVSRTILFENIE